MPKLAFCSIAALDRPLAEVAELAAKVELDGIEVTAREPHLAPMADRAEARAAGASVRAAGIEVIAYGSYLGRGVQLRPEDVPAEAAVLEELRAPLWRVWAEPGNDGSDADADFARVVRLMRVACDAAPDATVVVERHIGSWADTPERVERLIEAVERDNFALNYQVLDLLPPEEADHQPADAARLVPLARYFHVKNYQPNPDPGGRMLPSASLAGGVLDYEPILAAARDAGYADPLSIEFLSHEPLPLEDKLATDVRWLRAAMDGLEWR